jgi:general secretion pathway protein C
MDRLKNIITASTLDVAKLANIVTIILVFFVIYRMAKITWLVVEPVAITPSSWQLPQANHQGSSSTVDFSDYKWFGQATTKAMSVELKPKTVTKAPKTKLNLILSGLVASSDAKRSMAIVEYQGKQDTYGIDDKIEGTRAVIHEIHHDRLILKNSGKYETLMLDGFDYNAGPVVSIKSPATRAKPAKKFSSKLAKSRSEILKNPEKITDYISITPVRDAQNAITGYRLNPGRYPSLFKQSGLQRNDLAVSINGYDLTDFSESVKVMTELKSMTDISITVERGGQLVDIQFGLPQ